MTRAMTRAMIGEAAGVLAAAGVASPRTDAELLLAHVLGISRNRLVLVDAVDAAQCDTFEKLVSQRVQRIPLQHLIGTAPMGDIDLAVGPGVFIPRPETELLLEWSLRRLAIPTPIVVDLCSGSGALALAIAHARLDAEVHAVEMDPAAFAMASPQRLPPSRGRRYPYQPPPRRCHRAGSAWRIWSDGWMWWWRIRRISRSGHSWRWKWRCMIRMWRCLVGWTGWM